MIDESLRIDAVSTFSAVRGHFIFRRRPEFFCACERVSATYILDSRFLDSRFLDYEYGRIRLQLISVDII